MVKNMRKKVETMRKIQEIREMECISPLTSPSASSINENYEIKEYSETESNKCRILAPNTPPECC